MLKRMALAAVMAMGAAAAPPEARPAGVPAGAVRVEDGKWRHTDTKGKAWVYVRTPFGVSRMPEEQAEAKAEVKAGPGLEVVEVRENEAVFQRATPFGKSRWTKARTALDEDEKAALEAALAKKKQ
jgi:hypothetical protein